MKFFHIIFLSLLPVLVLAQGGWDIILSESDSSWTIQDMDVFDQYNVRFIGSSYNNDTRFFLSTENGGVDWDTVYFDANVTDFKSLSFYSLSIGYILTTGIENDNGQDYLSFKVYKTYDSGASWEVIYSSPSDFPWIFGSNMAMEFYNDTLGIITGQSLGAYTTDGGNSWTALTDVTMAGNRGTLKGGVYAAFSGSYSCYSSDTLENFHCKQVFEGASAINGDVYKNTLGDHLLYVGGLDGNGTSLGYPGYNFGIISISELDEPIQEEIHFPFIGYILDVDRTENFVYAVSWAGYGEDYRFIKSDDFGETWYSQGTSSSELIFSAIVRQIECVNDSVCYAYAGPNIYRTINGGGPPVEQVEANHVSVVLGVEENKLEVILFPNPAESTLRINTNEIVSEVQIFSVQGSLIEGKIFTPTNQIELDVSDLSPGIYILKVSSENSSSQTRFVKL